MYTDFRNRWYGVKSTSTDYWSNAYFNASFIRFSNVIADRDVSELLQHISNDDGLQC